MRDGSRRLPPPLQLRSDAQAMAALGTAGTDNGAAPAGAHSHQEAVRPLAADDGGLISTFHGGITRRKLNTQLDIF